MWHAVAAARAIHVEITTDNQQCWLCTFKSPEISARSYDVVTWRFGRPGFELSFTDVESRREAEFLIRSFRL
jgi:hypothetical protein